METVQPDFKFDYSYLFEAFEPQFEASASFWTGGTRKNCIGQYGWCFSRAASFDNTLESQTLSSGNGACVLTKRVLNPNNGQFEITLVNADCNMKAQLACVTNSAPDSVPTRHVRKRKCCAIL
jgi:hypothetical protein